MPNIISVYINVLNKLPVMVLITLAALSVILGDYAAKAWSVNQKPIILLISFLGYFLSAFFYIPTLLRESLIVSSVIWVLLSTIGFLVIGILIFKESLSTIQIIAVIFGVLSILVLGIAE